MTTQQKQDIVALIQEEKQRLGSFAKVSRKCDVSEATISQMVNANWELITDALWAKVGAGLGYRPDGWQVAETTNTRMVWEILSQSKQESMFTAISHRAGSGKTASLKAYESVNRNRSVFYLSCREWAKREFLINLARHLGIENSGGAGKSIDDLLMQVVHFFKVRRNARPILILDEADKLKAPAMRTLITLYNECEDGLGITIAGTDHLEKQMTQDARYNRKGADELISRFGRRFFHLVGAMYTDVRDICQANGIQDQATIKNIFKECEPVKRMLGNNTVDVVEDLRRVKRAVQRELLRRDTSLQPMEAAAP
jgi:DNA transposition AAA+ family ATPase